MGELAAVMFVPGLTNGQRINAALTIAERVPRPHVATTLMALGLASPGDPQPVSVGDVDGTTWWQELRHYAPQPLGAS